MSNLFRLDLSEKLGGDPRSDVAKSIEKILFACRNHPIYQVDLSNNDMYDDGMKHIFEFLKVNTTINTLIMNNCGLGVKSPAFLGMALLVNPKLKLRRLFLDNNNIHDLGLKQLGLFLSKMGSIEELSVSNNVKDKSIVSDEGISWLVDNICKCV